MNESFRMHLNDLSFIFPHSNYDFPIILKICFENVVSICLNLCQIFPKICCPIIHFSQLLSYNQVSSNRIIYQHLHNVKKLLSPQIYYNVSSGLVSIGYAEYEKKQFNKKIKQKINKKNNKKRGQPNQQQKISTYIYVYKI